MHLHLKDIDEFMARNNGELLNAFGNFFNRTVTFAHKYFDGIVPEADPDVARQYSLGLGADAQRTIAAYERAMTAFELQRAVAALTLVIRHFTRARFTPWQSGWQGQTGYV